MARQVIRSANRQYHIMHPELHLETSTQVLLVWTSLVAAVSAAGWHFLGWVFVLAGSTGWTTRQLPRLLSGLMILGGIAALFVYQFPDYEGIAAFLAVIVSFWQGAILLRSDFDGEQEPDRD